MTHRLLITGANGFIGSHVVREALARGHQVWAATRPGADHRRLHRIGPGLRVIGVDSRDPGDMRHALDAARPTTLVHLAWPVPPGRYRHDAANHDGEAMTARWFEAAAARGVPHVLGVGTCLELGAMEGVRQEGDAASPTCLYGRTKDRAHRSGRAILEARGTTLTWARLFHTFGPGESAGWLVPDALATWRAGRRFAATEGHAVRDWLHVRDLAGALLTLAERAPGGVAHVASGTGEPVRRALQILARRCGTPELLALGARPAPQHEIAWLTGDPATLTTLGWRPRLDLESAIAHTVEAYTAGRWIDGGSPFPALAEAA